MPKPSELRTAEIESITRSGEDEALVVLKNGNTHEFDIDDVLQDWLHLHKKTQAAKQWTAAQKD